jgi:hypothetical protein
MNGHDGFPMLAVERQASGSPNENEDEGVALPRRWLANADYVPLRKEQRFNIDHLQRPQIVSRQRRIPGFHAGDKSRAMPHFEHEAVDELFADFQRGQIVLAVVILARPNNALGFVDTIEAVSSHFHTPGRKSGARIL